MNDFFEEDNFWDDDFSYDPYDDGVPPLEEFLNNPDNIEWGILSDLSDSIVGLVKTEDKMEMFLIRTLLHYFGGDYTKARKFTSSLFKRLYLEEKQDNKTDQIIEETLKEYPSKEKLDDLLLEMEQIPDKVEETPLDGIDTIEDLLDKFSDDPDKKE